MTLSKVSMATFSGLDLLAVCFGIIASIGCCLNHAIDTMPSTLAEPQVVYQLALSMGGFLFSLLLHRRHSGSWASPLKLLTCSSVSWFAAENLDAMLGGVIFGDHPWDPERMQVPMLGSMPAQQPVALQWHVYLSLLMADSCLGAGLSKAPQAPRAVLGALFATLLDAAAEPAWLAARLYQYTACQEDPGYCMLGVDPRNYVGWIVLMSICYGVFVQWDTLPTVSCAPRSVLVIPYVAWFTVLVWYTNLIRHSGGATGLQLCSLYVGTTPLIVTVCCYWVRHSLEAKKLA